MKMLSGEIPADQGEIIKNGEVRIAMLPQDVPDDLPGTVYDVVASGGREHLDILKHYHDLTMQVAKKNDGSLLNKLEGFNISWRQPVPGIFICEWKQ